nr:hypothetical protein [Sphingomonas daechungensis]
MIAGLALCGAFLVRELPIRARLNFRCDLGFVSHAFLGIDPAVLVGVNLGEERVCVDTHLVGGQHSVTIPVYLVEPAYKRIIIRPA